MIRKIATILKVLAHLTAWACWILTIGIPILAIVNSPDEREMDLQRPAERKDSGYFYDEHGPHLLPLIDDNPDDFQYDA